MIPTKELKQGDYVYIILRYRNGDFALVGGKEEDVVMLCEIEKVFDDGRVCIRFYDDFDFPHREIVKNTMFYKKEEEAKDKLKEILKLEKEMQKKFNLKVAIVAVLIIIAAICFMLTHN